MSHHDWQWAFDYRRDDDGVRVGSLPIEPDWEPLLECARFEAVRAGSLAPSHDPGCAEIEPEWQDTRGAPFVARVGVRVAERRDAPTPNRTVLDSQDEFFRHYARAGSQTLIERGQLAEGERYRFRLCAYPKPADVEASDEDDGFAFESGADLIHLPMRETPIAPLLERAIPVGADPYEAAASAEAHDDDLPVFLPQSVIEQALTRSSEAGDYEVGGVLLSHLSRCPETQQVFLELTAQVPALHAVGESMSLTFTPDTWAAARAAVELRGQHENWGGWWHFHWNFARKSCAQCPEEQRRVCPLSTPFFSETDVHLHRTVFPRAHQVALLVSDHGGTRPEIRLFGWREGRVRARAYRVLPD